MSAEKCVKVLKPTSIDSANVSCAKFYNCQLKRFNYAGQKSSNRLLGKANLCLKSIRNSIDMSGRVPSKQHVTVTSMGTLRRGKCDSAGMLLRDVTQKKKFLRKRRSTLIKVSILGSPSIIKQIYGSNYVSLLRHDVHIVHICV